MLKLFLCIILNRFLLYFRGEVKIILIIYQCRNNIILGSEGQNVFPIKLMYYIYFGSNFFFLIN